jgi:hypothetical protein
VADLSILPSGERAPLYRRLSKPKNYSKHGDVEEKNVNAPDEPLTQVIHYIAYDFTD